MSSTRAAWKPRSANTRMPASSKRRMVLRPCARISRAAAASGAAAPRAPAARPPRVTRGDLYASLMIPNVVAEAARRFGDRTAYVTERGWPLTYADVDQISDEVAVGLAREGVGEGDVVALVLPPGAEYLLAYCAAAKLGAITAGVNDRLSSREQSAVLDLAQPKLTITDATTMLTDLRVAGASPAPLTDDPDRPVAIIFTSGTTGLPKG